MTATITATEQKRNNTHIFCATVSPLSSLLSTSPKQSRITHDTQQHCIQRDHSRHRNIPNISQILHSTPTQLAVIHVIFDRTMNTNTMALL